MQSELTLSLLLETKSLPPPPPTVQFPETSGVCGPGLEKSSLTGVLPNPSLWSRVTVTFPVWAQKWPSLKIREDCFQVAQLLTNSSRTGFSALQLISSSESNCFLRWRWTTEMGAYQGERGGHCIMVTATNSLKCLMMPCHSLIEKPFSRIMF